MNEPPKLERREFQPVIKERVLPYGFNYGFFSQKSDSAQSSSYENTRELHQVSSEDSKAVQKLIASRCSAAIKGRNAREQAEELIHQMTLKSTPNLQGRRMRHSQESEKGLLERLLTAKGKKRKNHLNQENIVVKATSPSSIERDKYLTPCFSLLVFLDFVR